MQYHVSRNGQQFGPYEESDLGGMILAGNILPDDTVWTPGMPNWLPAIQVFPHIFRRPVSGGAPAPAAAAPGPQVRQVSRPGAPGGPAVRRPARAAQPAPQVMYDAYGQPVVMPMRPPRPPAGAGAWIGSLVVDFIILVVCCGPAWHGYNRAVKAETARIDSIVAEAKQKELQEYKGINLAKIPKPEQIYSEQRDKIMEHQPWTWITIGLLAVVIILNIALLATKGRTITGALLGI